MSSLILASASPRRQELLGSLGIPFTVKVSEVDESLLAVSTPDVYVKQLAMLKGTEVFSHLDAGQKKETVVLSADTIVVCDDCILGKPADEREARDMLHRLSGREHEVMTGVCITNAYTSVSRCAITRVWFRPLSEEEIEQYLISGEPYDKAGGYGIQGGAGCFVTRIEGAYDTVVGLPRALLCRMLKEECQWDVAAVNEINKKI